MRRIRRLAPVRRPEGKTAKPVTRRVSRRLALTGAAATLVAAAGGPVLAQARRAAPAKAAAPPAAAAGRAFFTARELAILDEVAELIIPADAKSGGARAAGVAAILDARIGESRDPAWRQSWREDLAEIDRLSRAMFARGFLEATPEQRIALLTRISRNEAAPKEAGDWAFGTIKWSVADVYYRTRIGIHDDLEYQGNVVQEVFAGTDVTRR